MIDDLNLAPAQVQLVARMAAEADVFVDAELNSYYIDGVNTEDGYFVAVLNGEEYTIEFADVDLETERFQKLTAMNPQDFAA